MTTHAPGEAGGHRRPDISPSLDRVGKPDPQRSRPRDDLGKEALYTTAPTARPSPQMEMRCRRCGVRSGLTVVAVVRMLKPPFFVNPLRRRVWARCPACHERSWLEVRTGQALRVLLDRRPRT